MTSVLACCPPPVLVPQTIIPEFDSSSMLKAALAKARDQQQRAKPTRKTTTGIANLPEELLSYIIQDNFEVRGLCTLAQVSPRFRQLASLDTTWQRLYEQKFGEVTGVVREAAVLAHSWKELYTCKLANDKQAEPWLTPCVHELAAVHQRIVKEQVAKKTGGVLFLLDGSGSVFQDDFQAMTRFVSQTFAALMQANSASQVGIIQFSTGINLHLPLDSYSDEAFKETIDGMARMNGGTNLTLAVDTAGNLMRDKLPEGSPRTLILLTDGRVDHYQGSETVQAVKRIQKEQGNLSVYAFGVGCGVGREELGNIVSATGCRDADCRYMALAVHPDSDHRW